MTPLSEWRARAARALREGWVEDGITAYRAVVAAVPGDAEAWYNLAYLLRCARRFDAALDGYGQALAHGIARPEEVHLNRAVIMAEFRERGAAAEAELRKAVALAPAFVPAWLNLGNLYEDQGRAAEARAAYAQVLAIDPGNGRAQARIAAIAVFEGRAAHAVPVLRETLARPGLRAAAAAEMGFALGQALDAEGRYDEAFAAFAEANRAAQQAMPPAYRYDRAAQERLVDALIAADNTPVARDGGGDDAPLFICGMFRSGSTLVEQMLSRHSRVTRGGELEIVPALAAEWMGQSWPAAVSDDAVAAMRQRYREEVNEIHPGADVLTDKRPDNFLYIGLIKRLFPQARIVATTRHLHDTALSVYFNYFDDSVSYGNDLGDIAHWLAQYERLMAHWRALYPDDIHDIAYDRLVEDPAPTIAALLRFCGLAWEEAVLRPDQADGPVRTASVWQVRQPLHRRSSGRWRHYARHLAPLTPLLGAPR